MELSPANLQALYVTFSQTWQEAFLKYNVSWQKVASLLNSDSESETHVIMDRVPQVREWVADRIVRNVSLRDQTLKNKAYEHTIGIDKFKVQDNKINAFKDVIRAQGEQAKKWPDVLIFGKGGALDVGDTAAAVGYDGLPFFSAAHPVNMDDPASAVQSNLFPNTPLNHANFSKVYDAMRSWVGADGLPLLVEPSVLLHDTTNRTAATQVLKEEWVSPTAAAGVIANGAPSKNSLVGLCDPLMVPDLNYAPGTWYLLATVGAIKPLIFQLRQAMQFVQRVKPDDTPVFEKHEFQYGIEGRGAAGYGPWFLAAKCTP